MATAAWLVVKIIVLIVVATRDGTATVEPGSRQN
jgi:hypothetical protein